MTQTANLASFKIGDKVFNKNFDNFERTGEIVERKGKLKVLTVLPENGKPYNLEIKPEWELLPSDAPSDILDAIIEKRETKNAPKEIGETEKPEMENEKTPEPEFVPMSDDEKAKRKTLISEYRRQDSAEQNAYLRKCEIIHELRELKLFRDDYKTFAEFAAAELNVTREYAQNLAQIGAFYTVSKDFIKNNKLSVNAINQLVRNQNKLAENIGLASAELSEFKPIIEKVLDATIEASKNDKGKINITPRIVDTVAKEIGETLSNLKTEKTGAELIALAAKTLGLNSADILTRTRQTLADTGKADKTPSNGAKTANGNDSPGVYAGVLSNLEIKCTLHTEFKGNKILHIGNGTIQTKCLCRFRQVGYDLIPYEIEGKRVKTA